MSFEWPWALALLVVVPLLAGALHLDAEAAPQVRPALRQRLAGAQAVGKGPGVKRHIPAVLYLAGARGDDRRPRATPGDGARALRTPAPSSSSIDVSGSMLAEDVEPNRMEATKKAVREFVEKQPNGVKIGVVSFTDFAALVAPPSTDRKHDARRHRPPATAARHEHRRRPAGRPRRHLQPPGRGSTSPGRPATRAPRPRRATELDVPPASIVLRLRRPEQHRPRPAGGRRGSRQRQASRSTRSASARRKAPSCRSRAATSSPRLDEPTMRGHRRDRPAASTSPPRPTPTSARSTTTSPASASSRTRRRRSPSPSPAPPLLVSMLAGGLGLLWFNRLP